MHFRPRVCVAVFIHLRMETPLCGRSGGHTGTAPTVSFGWIACGWFCLLVGEDGAHEPTPSVLYF